MGKNVLNFPRQLLSALQQAIRAIKGLRGQPDGFVGTDSDGYATTSHLGSGTASGATVLYGNNTWGAAAGALSPGDYGDVEVVTGTNWTVESAAGALYVSTMADLTAALSAFASSGGTIYVAPGTYLPSARIEVPSNVRIVGAGADITIFRQTDYDTDIFVLTGGNSILEGMKIMHGTTASTGNGYGGVGCGRGVVSEASQAVVGSDNVSGNILKNLHILNTASWGIYFTGLHAMEQVQYTNGFDSGGGTLVSDTAEHPYPVWGRTAAAASTFSVTSTTTTNSRTVTSAAGFADVRVGQYVYGTGIPHATYVTAKVSQSSITISRACTSGSSPGTVSLTFKRDTNCCLNVEPVIDHVTIAFTNSGGAMFMGSGDTTCRVYNLKTNNYSYGSYTQNAAGSSVCNTLGAVHIYNHYAGQFFGPIFQSPSAQSGGPPVTHDDIDATMLSISSSNTMEFYSPYCEVLSANCVDGADWYYGDTVVSCQKNSNTTIDAVVAGTLSAVGLGDSISGTGIPAGAYVTAKASNSQITISAAATDSAIDNLTFRKDRFGYRQYWLFTLDGTSNIAFYEPWFGCTTKKLNPTDSATYGGYYEGYPARLLRTSNGTGGAGFSMYGGRVAHWRLHYGNAPFPTPSAPFSSGDFYPCSENGSSTSDPWNRDDFLLQGDQDGRQNAPVVVENLDIVNYNGGGRRETTSPISEAVWNGEAFRINTSDRIVKAGAWTDRDMASAAASHMNDFAVRVPFSQTLRGGLFVYNAGSVAVDGASQREGWWGVANRPSDVNWRQIPWIRVHTSAYPSPIASDLWMRLHGSPSSNRYPNAEFNWYSAGAWQAIFGLPRTTTAAGDLAYYSATDTPARLAIGSARKVLMSVSGAPSWQTPDVDVVGNFLTMGAS